MNTITCHRLGCVAYLEALELQRSLVERRRRGEIDDRLLLLEHPPVITRGKRECPEDFLTSPDAIAAEGIDVVEVDRGGRLTYHGPGQLVGYLIFDVARRGGVKAFVHAIEEMLIGVCGAYGVEAVRDPDHPGVWAGRQKVAALGLHVARGISNHGFALNVNCDLGAYRHIVACGIADRGVTSLARLGNADVTTDDVAAKVVEHCSRAFESEVSLRIPPR